MKKQTDMVPGIENDLDTLLNLESQFQAEGHRQSSEAGAKAGLSEGRAMGWKAGVALTAELEFFHGAASALIAVSEAFDDEVPARAVTVAVRIVDLCQTNALSIRGNDPSLDMEYLADYARNLFRQMAAFAGMPGLRFDLGTRSIMADLSF